MDLVEIESLFDFQIKTGNPTQRSNDVIASV